MTRHEELQLMELALRVQYKDAHECMVDGLSETQLGALRDTLARIKFRLYQVQNEMESINMASKKEKLLKIEHAYKMGWISKETYERRTSK